MLSAVWQPGAIPPASFYRILDSSREITKKTNKPARRCSCTKNNEWSISGGELFHIPLLKEFMLWVEASTEKGKLFQSLPLLERKE